MVRARLPIVVVRRPALDLLGRAPSGLPTDLPDLGEWWDADDAARFTISDTDKVDDWTDKGPLGIVVAGAATARPVRATGVAALNGRAVVQFDGINDELVSSSGNWDISNEEETLFIVGKFPSATNKYIYSQVAAPNNEALLYVSAPENARWERGNSTDGAGAILNWSLPSTAYQILVLRKKLNDGAKAFGVWVGGGSPKKTTTHTVGAPTATAENIRFANVLAFGFYNCEIAAFIRYRRKLPNAQIDWLCLNHLVPKWGAGAGEPSWTKMAA